MAELVLCSGFFLVYLVEEVVQLLVHPNAHQDNLNSHQSSKAVDKGQGRDGERANSCCDATNHNDMEMQPRSESSTSESSIDPGYNPKYSVRLSLSTSSVFPNYHSPDSLKPSPQEKPFPSPSRLFLFLAKPIDEKKSQQHQRKSHQKHQKTHKPQPRQHEAHYLLLQQFSRRSSDFEIVQHQLLASEQPALCPSWQHLRSWSSQIIIFTPCATSSFLVLTLILFHNSYCSTTRVSSSPRSQLLNSPTEPPYFPSLAG